MFLICDVICERWLIAEQKVSSKISCFHAFVIEFMVNAVQGVIKMFAVDAH